MDTTSNSLPDGVSVNYFLLEVRLVMQAVRVGSISSKWQNVSTMSSVHLLYFPAGCC